MHNELAATGRTHGINEALEKLVAVFIVDADARLDRDRYVDVRKHDLHAVGNRIRIGHQAGTKLAALHPVAGTADIDVDLIVAEFGATPGRLDHQVRITAAQLQCKRVFGRIVNQHCFVIAMMNRCRGNHLRVQHCARAQQPHEVTAVTVRPVHHRRDGDC